VVLIIDEAQDLSIEALEQVRLLTNLETDTQKLLQVILLGQPELRALLAREDLRQLAQRITARFHLTPLDAAETERYLRHRHAIAGGLHLPFSPSAIKRLHAHAGGVPRLINIIAERSLLAGYARDATRVDARLVDMAAKEALAPRMRRKGIPMGMLAAATLAVLACAAWLAFRPSPSPPVAVARAAITPDTASTPTDISKASIRPPRLQGDALVQHVSAVPASSPEAWRALLQAWRLPTDDADIAIASRCTPSLAPDVFCLRLRAGIDTLASIGRPVLLRLRGADHAAWAMLLGVDALDARLDIGGAVVDVPRVALQRVWTGDCIAIWRTAGAGDASTSQAGDVRAFQAAHGLASDGVIGPETRFALAASGPGPRLLRELD
jgi:general secretion pathway protein A